MKRLALVLLVGLFLGMGVAAYADAPISIMVDGRKVETDVPPRIEQGRTLVPLRAISEALGATVEWVSDDAGDRVRIFTAGTEYPISHNYTFGGNPSLKTSLSSLAAVGPAAALSQYLCGLQSQSLAGASRVIVRFELYDFKDQRGLPPDSPTEWGRQGFRFAARIYYANLKGELAAGQHQAIFTYGPNSSRSVGTTTPQVEASWYEDIAIDVLPAGEPRVEKAGDQEIATWGIGGWRVNPESIKLLRTVPLKGVPFVVHGTFGR